MRILTGILAGLAWLLPAMAAAHPHMWVSQQVRVVASDGKFTHVELEWRFDPYSSEEEIPAIDEDGDGRISAREVELLARDMLPELQKVGFMAWLNTGAQDFRLTSLPVFSTRIDDPAVFVPPEWDRTEGDNNGMPMPKNKQVEQLRGPRNLVYVMRFTLPEPVAAFSLTAFEPDDFMRIEVDKASLPRGCTLAKHPTYKSEFIKGHPVFADTVSCRIP